MTRRRAAAVRWIFAALAGAAGVPGFAPFRIAPLPIVALAVLFALWAGGVLRRDEPGDIETVTPRAAAAAVFALVLG